MEGDARLYPRAGALQQSAPVQRRPVVAPGAGKVVGDERETPPSSPSSSSGASTFHDGKEMNADDVIYSMERHRGENSVSMAKAYVRYGQRVEEDR